MIATIIPSPHPVAILIGSVLFIVVCVARLKIPAFYVLITAAVLVALASALGGSNSHRFVLAIQQVMNEGGAALAKLGFPIVAAAVIGMCLMESGSADKIVRRAMAVFGPERTGAALLVCSFVLSAPVFIDTVLMLLLPLGRAISLRTGKHFLLYVLVICAGASISNGIVPPAPGPLFVAVTLGIDLGTAILTGLVFGIVPLVCAYFMASWLDRRNPVTVRSVPGSSLESLHEVIARPEAELPGLMASLAPVDIPMLLIAAATGVGFLEKHVSRHAMMVTEFLGEKNVALFIGASIAVTVYIRAKKLEWSKLGTALYAPLEAAAVIILVIAAGGAYGAMIKASGIGDSMRIFAHGHTINYVLLAWFVAAVMRAAQGSATVASIAAVGIMTSIAGVTGFGVHPVYILLAIGFGSKFLDWMNNPGFWVICRIGGLTQQETLRNWTLLVCFISVVGLVEVLTVSALFPHFFVR